MSEIMSMILMISIISGSIFLLYLGRSKTSYGKIIRKYTDITNTPSMLEIQTYHCVLNIRRFVDGGTIEIEPMHRTFKLSHSDYESVKINDQVEINKRNGSILNVESPTTTTRQYE